MKVRLGFVSNSSSSSYVIAGIIVGNVKDIDKIKFDKNENYILFGNHLSEGQDLIELNSSLIKWFSKNKDKYDFHCDDGTIMMVIDSAYDDCSMNMNIQELYNKGYENLTVVGGYSDYHSTQDTNDAEREYLGREE